MPNLLHKTCHTAEVNCTPLSEVKNSGTLNLKIQQATRASANAVAVVDSNGYRYTSTQHVVRLMTVSAGNLRGWPSGVLKCPRGCGRVCGWNQDTLCWCLMLFCYFSPLTCQTASSECAHSVAIFLHTYLEDTNLLVDQIPGSARRCREFITLCFQLCGTRGLGFPLDMSQSTLNVPIGIVSITKDLLRNC